MLKRRASCGGDDVPGNPVTERKRQRKGRPVGEAPTQLPRLARGARLRAWCRPHHLVPEPSLGQKRSQRTMGTTAKPTPVGTAPDAGLPGGCHSGQPKGVAGPKTTSWQRPQGLRLILFFL